MDLRSCYYAADSVLARGPTTKARFLSKRIISALMWAAICAGQLAAGIFSRTRGPTSAFAT